MWYAFGITAYDSNQEVIEDPSIGVLQPYYKSWGIKEGVGSVDFEPLPTRKCTEAELHVNDQSDPNSKFFKAHELSQGDQAFYYKKLKCLNMDHIEVQGDYNSPRTRSFVLLFERCDNSTYTGPGFCKSDEYITNWLKRKFIFMVHNQKRFSTLDYKENKVTDETQSVWLPINSQIREEAVYKVQLMDLYLQDNNRY